MLAFVLAGSVPLLPYFLPGLPFRFPFAILTTLLVLFTVGAMRSTITKLRWWRAGMEMLLIGAVAAAVSYGVGFFIAGVA